MAQRIRTLLPPGGFSNLVGHHMAALDVGLERIRAAARASALDPRPHLAAAGALEASWVHRALGGVPTPPPPADDAALDAWLGWLDAVRTVTQMVLRPLADRDLERLVRVEDDAPPEGARTLRRLLSDLCFEQGRLCGRIEA